MFVLVLEPVRVVTLGMDTRKFMTKRRQVSHDIGEKCGNEEIGYFHSLWRGRERTSEGFISSVLVLLEALFARDRSALGCSLNIDFVFFRGRQFCFRTFPRILFLPISVSLVVDFAVGYPPMNFQLSVNNTSASSTRDSDLIPGFNKSHFCRFTIIPRRELLPTLP